MPPLHGEPLTTALVLPQNPTSDPNPHGMDWTIIALMPWILILSYTTAFGRVVTMWKVPDFVKPDTGIDRPMEVSATFAICLPEK